MTADEMVAFRPATADDDGFLRHLYGTTRADELAAVGWADEQVDAFITMQWQAQTHDYSTRCPDARLDIVIADGVDVGRVWVDHRPGHLHLLDISLLPGWRGRGIGTALLTRLQAEATSDNSTIGHSVAKDNIDALRLYHRLGFEIIDDLEFHHVMRWTPGAG